MNNFIFKIEYTLKSDLDSPSRAGRRHVRRYNALSESIALEMFKETVSSGSLIGESPEIVSVIKLDNSRQDTPRIR